MRKGTNDADIETAIGGFIFAVSVGILGDDAPSKVEGGLELWSVLF